MNIEAPLSFSSPILEWMYSCRSCDLCGNSMDQVTCRPGWHKSRLLGVNMPILYRLCSPHWSSSENIHLADTKSRRLNDSVCLENFILFQQTYCKMTVTKEKYSPVKGSWKKLPLAVTRRQAIRDLFLGTENFINFLSETAPRSDSSLVNL